MLLVQPGMGTIGALFQRDGTPASAENIERMAASLRIHGPLIQRHLCIGSAALCWNKLAYFSPEDRFDRQPMVEGSMALVFSGRLHFRMDLARALGLDSARACTMADGALAFAAWRKWGKAALGRLEGSFALIVSNEDTGRMLAARSPLSAPPIVYHAADRQLAIASAPRALFALPGIARELDEQRIADSLILNHQDIHKTFYKQIINLPRGHWLEASRDRLELKKYYQIGDVEPVRFATGNEYVEAADALLKDAVEDAMRAKITPACTISAGLDSSCVAAVGLEAIERGAVTTREQFIGFTAVPEPGWDGRTYGFGRLGDESGPVTAFMQKYPKLAVEFVDSAGQSLDRDVELFIQLAEAPPFGWNNFHWLMEINRRVRANGRNVLLGGASGNRTLSFSNRAIYPDLFRRGHWREMHGHLARLNVRQGMLKRYYRYVFQPMLPAAVIKAIAHLRGDLSHTGWTGFSAINPEFAATMNVDVRAKELGWDDSYSTFRSSRQMMMHMSQTGAGELSGASSLAMKTLSGIESRDPLGYQRISEFCAAIPEQQFMHKGRDRWLMRRLMKDRLPAEILSAPRGRQAADWHLRMRRDLDRYRREVERMDADPDHSRMFDVPRIRRALDSWPERTPLEKADHPDHMLAMVGIGRALTTSRFINWVNGKND